VINQERLNLARTPRTVFRARCLQEDCSLPQFLNAVESGKDLNPHQSRNYRPTFNDLLLNDLGIRHFHLTAPTARREDPLLFAIATGDAFYAIGVGRHSTFTKDALIEVVHANWPDLLAQFREPGVKPGSYRGPSDRVAFRNLGFVTKIQVNDGTVYWPPGGGLTTGGLGKHRGLSMSVVVEANRAMTYIRNLECDVLDAADRLAAMNEGSDKRLMLAYKDGQLFGFSESARPAIDLGTSPIRLRIDAHRWLSPR